jgi:hypothetical protein
VNTGISSSSAEKSGYASETVSKVSNHYESNTTVKQVAAANEVEKIPLDYECPKQSIATVEPAAATQNLKGDCSESASKINESEASNSKKDEPASNDTGSRGSVSEEAVIVVIAETAFSAEANVNDPQQKEAEIIETKEKQE